jgi:hypothetical protein
VQQVVEDAGLHGLLDEALLLVTELVTNAVVHAGTEIELRVETGSSDVRIEVSDAGPGRIWVAGAPSDTQEGGRGVWLLDAVAAEWGTSYAPGRKAVWFRLGRTAPVPAQPHEARPSLGRAQSDIAWLVGLPVDLEARLGASGVVRELLHRVVEGLGLQRGWVLTQHAEEGDWRTEAAYDDLPAPTLAEVRANRFPGQTVLDLTGAAGGSLGVLVLRGASLSDEQQALAALVAARVAVVLRDERARTAQRAGERSAALLAEASEMFAGTLDARLAMTLAAQLVVPRFAQWAAVWATYEHEPRLVAVAHAREELVGPLREGFESDHGTALLDRLVHSPTDAPMTLTLDELPVGLSDDRMLGALVLPLVARRRLLGLVIVGPTSRVAGPVDAALLRDLTRVAALAIDNARLYEERSSVALALQEYLLPAALPQAVGLAFGARYAAAGEGTEVGGDFYDVFPCSDGWGLAIGDVCGKGAPAAAITGMARDVVRVLLADGSPPAQTLSRLNDSLLALGDRGRFCTALLGRVVVDGEGLLVCLANAGHPQPILVRPDGTAALVGSTGTLLGVVEEVTLADDSVRLKPGESLVLYTDGVTERRGDGGLFGDERLLEVLRTGARLSAPAMASAVEEAVLHYGRHQPGARDDLAVLVMQAIPAVD